MNKGRRKREIELPHQCRRRHQLASTQSQTNARIQTNARTGACTSPAHSSSRGYSRAKHITCLSTSCDANRNSKHPQITLKAKYSANPAKARAWIVWLLPHPRIPLKNIASKDQRLNHWATGSWALSAIMAKRVFMPSLPVARVLVPSLRLSDTARRLRAVCRRACVLLLGLEPRIFGYEDQARQVKFTKASTPCSWRVLLC